MCCIGIDGPKGIGKTAVLQQLERQGYNCAIDNTNTPDRYNLDDLQVHINRYKSLLEHTGLLLIEVTPWSYVYKHSSEITVPELQAARKLLIALPLPALHIVLTTSGRQCALRNHTVSADLDQHSTRALRQMRDLYMVGGITYMIDSTPAVEQVAARVHAKLNTSLFALWNCAEPDLLEADVNSANFSGMEELRLTLAEGSGITTDQQAMAFAQQHGIDTQQYTDYLERIQRVAAAFKSNPGLVNPARPAHIKAQYF